MRSSELDVGAAEPDPSASEMRPWPVPGESTSAGVHRKNLTAAEQQSQIHGSGESEKHAGTTCAALN